MKKRLISLLLAFSMMLTFLPAGAVSAFAEGTADESSKETLLKSGDSIENGGVYCLQGDYTEGIKIDTSAPVTINIADDAEVSFDPKKNAESNVLLDVVSNSDLTVNNKGVYNGPTFLHTSTESNNAKVTIHGGRYNITNQPGVRTRAFAFDEGGSVENPIVVDGVHIDADSYCKGIDVGNGEQTAPKVMIKNSEINCFGRGYDDGAIKIVDNQGSVTLENVTVYAANISAIMILGGNLTINSGRYTSDGSQAVNLYDNRTPNVPEVTINGGTFSGNLTIAVNSGTMEIHGGTFTSTKEGGVVSNSCAHTIIDSTVSVPEFNSERGDFSVIRNNYGGYLEFNDGIINVSGDTESGFHRAALYTKGPYGYPTKTEINGGTIKGAEYGILVEEGEPDVILRNVQFENNGTDIYLGSGQKITIEKTFKNNATIGCKYPSDGRQLTKATETDYQKDLNLTSANAGYLVGYKKTADGKGEYRCLSKEVGVTIEGLENAVIKEGESKNFTVKVDPKDNAKLGEAVIDFGDKNSEIEYKDKNGAYQPMPKDGLEVDLSGDKNDYVFHITPKNAGEQTLTAAVVRDDVKLGTDSKDYTVAGRVHTTVTIEGLENAVIKEGESKDFTVKVDPKDDANLGEAFIDFGDKNSEIEYKDESGEYKPMPEGGLKIGLGDGEVEREFRIAPKETGEQTLTAAVKKGENELAKDKKDFVVSEMPILTLKDGVITSVTVPGKNGADPEDITEIVKKNANEDGSFHVPEGATVSVAFDKDAFADSGLKFGHWDITGLDDPNAYQDKESFDFVMPAKGVTLKAMTQDASIEDDEPDIVGPIVIGTTVVVGGAVLGYQAYSLGAEFAGKLMALPYFPSNRSALAMMLWEDAGKPMPESELLYPDVGQEEQDMDLQHAARWAMENELIPDLNDEGTAPEEMKFYPDNAVSKIDVLKAWQKAQELKQNA